MSMVTKKWPDFKERCKFMFNSDGLSDVKFVVRASQHGDCSDRKRSKMVIPAHKFLLSIRSPVFFAMFCGKMAETEEHIDLPDCEYDGMFEFLRYIYTDEIFLTGSNVMQVAYLAAKYMIPCLAKECVDYLRKSLDSCNVFDLLKHAQQFGHEDLLYHCWDFIDTKTNENLKSSELLTIERSLLEQLVERDTLTVKEVDLFRAVIHWAERECERQKLKADGPGKRVILGEQIIKNKRFSLMKESEFTQGVLDTNILTQEEETRIMKYFSSKLSNPFYPDQPVGFVNDNRVGSPLRCCRFFEFRNGHNWENDPESPEEIEFTVDKDIILHGVSLFGNYRDQYSVTVKMLNTTGGSVVTSKSGCYESEAKGKHCESPFFYGFDVLFDEVVAIHKDVKCCIQASIAGPLSGYGYTSFDEAYCAGLTFIFEDKSDMDLDGNPGQVAELLFKVKERIR